MLHKRILLGLTGLLFLAACQQPGPDQDISDQGGKAPVVSAFTATQLGTGYYEMAWSISDAEREELRCMIQIDDGAVAGYDWRDLDEADEMVWISSMAPEEADYNGFVFPVGGPDYYGPSTDLFTGENYITPCTNLDKAYLAVRKPGTFYLRLAVLDSMTPVKTAYSKILTLKVGNLKPYIAGFGAYIDGESDGWTDTFFPWDYFNRQSVTPKASTVTSTDFPLTVTFFWDISDAFGEPWKGGNWYPWGGKGSQQWEQPGPTTPNFLKCSLDLDGNNIYEVTLNGDCRNYQGNAPWLGDNQIRPGYTHTFTKPGSYNVKLKVEDRTGASHVSTVRVGLENNTPPYTAGFINMSALWYLPDWDTLRSSLPKPGAYEPELKGYPELFFWTLFDLEENVDLNGLKCYLDPEGDGTFQITLANCAGDGEIPFARSKQPLGIGDKTVQQPVPDFGCGDWEGVGTACVGSYVHAYPKRGQYFPRLKVVDSKGLSTETQLGFNPYFYGFGGMPLPIPIGGDKWDEIMDICTFDPPLRSGSTTPNAGSVTAPLVRCDTLPAMHFLPVIDLKLSREGSAYADFWWNSYQFGIPFAGTYTCTFDPNIFDSTPPEDVDCDDGWEWDYDNPGRYTARATINDGVTTWSDTESICMADISYLEGVDVGEDVDSAQWSPDGKFIAVGNYEYIDIYDARNRNMLIETDWVDTGDKVRALSWSPDSRYLVVVDLYDFEVYRVTTTGELQYVDSSDGTNDFGQNYLNDVAWSPNGKYIAAGSDENTIRIYSTTNLNNLPDSWISTIEYSTDGNSGHDDDVNAIAWSPDSRYLVAGDDDEEVKIWDLADPSNPQIVATLYEPNDYIFSVAWSPDGRLIASGDDDSEVHFWDVSDLRNLDDDQYADHIRYKGEFDTGGYEVVSLAFSPDSRTLIAGTGYDDDDGAWTDLYDVSNVNRIRWLDWIDSGADYVNAVGFSPDGRSIFTGDTYDDLEIYDANDLNVCKY